MAISRVHNSVGLKLLHNYGEISGELVKKYKTFQHVRTNAPDDAIYAVAEAIDGMMEPTLENVFVVATDELLKSE